MRVEDVSGFLTNWLGFVEVPIFNDYRELYVSRALKAGILLTCQMSETEIYPGTDDYWEAIGASTIGIEEAKRRFPSSAVEIEAVMKG